MAAIFARDVEAVRILTGVNDALRTGERAKSVAMYDRLLAETLKMLPR